MRISIIPEDKKIIVDRRTVDLEDDAPWDFDDKHIHAIQWKDSRGELEYEDIDGEDPAPNKVFGEDEFQDIVQPYLDYYNSFLDAHEKKELESTLQEEMNLAAHTEELNLDRLENEAQLKIIEDLQIQNKELRDEREELYEATSKLEQASVFDKQVSLIELEREKAARESEKSILEAAKADEFFEKKSLELAQKYDELFHDFEKEKEAFIDERKQYQELLQKEREKMEREEDLSMKQLALEDEEREKKKEMDEKLRMVEEEQLEMTKIELALQKQVLEISEENNAHIKDEMVAERLRERSQLEREREIFEINKEMELDILMKQKESVLDQMSGEDIGNEILKSVRTEFENMDNVYKEEQERINRNKELDNIKGGARQIVDEYVERKSIERGEEKSIDEILTLMEDIDPEKLYTALTDSEREDNDFPVDKAVKWFASLKEVLDKNS